MRCCQVTEHKLSHVKQGGCWAEMWLPKNQQGASTSNNESIIWMFSFHQIIALWIISFSSLKCQALRKYTARKQGTNGLIILRGCFSSAQCLRLKPVSAINIVSSRENGQMIRPNLWPPTLGGKWAILARFFLLFTLKKKKKSWLEFCPWPSRKTLCWQEDKIFS